MLIVYHLVRLLLGKVLVFGVLVVLLFGATLAVRHLHRELPAISELFEEHERLVKEEAALTSEIAADQDALTEVDGRRGELEGTLLAQSKVRIEGERKRLQELVDGARDAAERAAAALETRREEIEEQVQREIADQNAACAANLRNKVGCWWDGIWADVEAALREAGRERIEEETAALRRELEARRGELDQAMRQLDTGVAALEKKLEEEMGVELAPILEEGRALATGLRTARGRLAAVQAASDALRTAQNVFWLNLRNRWREHGSWVLSVAVLLLLAPFAKRAFWYYGLLRVAEGREPMRLDEGAPEGTSAGTAEVECVAPSLTVVVSAEHPLLVRPTFVTSHEGREGFKALYDWRYPFVSYAAGLVLLNTYAPADGEEARILVADPLDGHPELMLVRLRDHPGMVLQPRNLVGVQGPVTVRSVWRFRSVHAWATLQFRYLLFGGTGAVIVAGGGHIDGKQVEGGDMRTLQSRVLGFDSRLGYATSRTGSFVQYLLGRSEPIEDRHTGEGLLLTQTALPASAANSPVERALDVLLSGLGKVLGF